MASFFICARVVESDTLLFQQKATVWETIPREGDWVHFDAEMIHASPVLDVWHWIHMEKPCIVIEVEVSEVELNKLAKEKWNWDSRPPYLFPRPLPC